MKRIIVLIVLILICFTSSAQFPLNPSSGVNNINQNWLGAYTFQRGMVAGTYADTTAANLIPYMKGVAFIMISTTSDNAIWFRNSAATKWIQLLPSGTPTGLGAWTTTLNTAIPTDISLNGYFGTTASNGIGFYTGGFQRFILAAGGLDFKSVVADTTLNKVLTYNTSTKELGYSYWFGGGVGTTPISSLTAATGANNISNGNFGQVWYWPTLAGNNALQLSAAASTTATGDERLLDIVLSGANANSTVTTYGAYITNSHSGTASTNIALRAGSTTGTTNIAAWFNRGSVDLGTVGTESGVLKFNGSTSGTVTTTVAAAAGTWTMTLPTTDGNSGEFLQTDGNGVTSWAAVTAGANTTLSNLTVPTAINTSLISDANNTDDLGSNTVGWRYGYFASAIGIGSGLTTPSAALDIRAADLFLTSSSVDQRFIIGEGLVSATDFYAISWNRTDNQLVFNDGGVAVSMRLEGDANANLFFADATNDRIGIGDATPASLFTVGSGDLFQVNTSGDLVKLKNVTYSWPSANAAGALTNDGSGNLSFAGYVKLTGTSTLTGNVSLAVQDGPYSFSVLNNSDLLLVIDRSAGFYGIGDMDNAAGNTWIKVNDATQTLFFKSSAITAGNAGDALTVVDPSTGEIGVQPNLAFQLHKQGTDIGATDGKVWVSDSVGNKTIISPHYFPSDIKPSEEMAWSFYSRNEKIGKEVFIDMLLLARKVEELTGEKLVYIKDIKK